ncbi:MAG: gamma-glutamyl-gamma-aminobutyrate hydrolase family protein [Actinomycetota bacterium]
MKIVAVSQRVDLFPDRGERRDALDQRLAAWLSLAGYLAAPVPNRLAGDKALLPWLTALRPAALLLSGGNDIGDAPERDQTESQMLDYAESRGIPVLGICRGMQMLAARAGSPAEPVTGHVRTRHVLTGELSGEVNSFHNFGFHHCPDGYLATAQAEDGSIEAIRHRELPWEGWMWHPEREPDFSSRDLDRLKALFP